MLKMTDFSFGTIPKDQTYDNLNVRRTLGDCETKIKAKCITADTVIAGQLITDAIDSGVTTLQTSNIVNMTGLNPTLNAMFIRIGNIVSLSFSINDGVRIQGSGGFFELEIPIASNFTNDYDAAGVLSNDDTNNQGAVEALPGTSRLLVLIDTDLVDYLVNQGRAMTQYVIK